MNTQQFERMKNAKGFIAALDQSGGSTPKALGLYGIPKDSYHSDDEMFTLIHGMRSRMITSPAFTSERILAAILFKNTVNRTIEDMYTADYLWEKKGVIPILKVDLGLQDLSDGVQLMKPITDLDETLELAKERHIFGTKMRSVIKAADPKGIKAIVEQQFEIGKQIIAAGLVPILEPEVDIHIPDKAEAEDLMLAEVKDQLAKLPADAQLMFKFTIPTKADLYAELMKDPHVVRIVALSGGYTREDANERLSKNHGMIASFSRALAEGLSVEQSDEEFNKVLDASIQGIYDASIA